MKLRVLRFPSTAGFRDYKSCFTPSSVSHPAKMNLRLLEYLIRTYTEEGNTVLDPMAGTFSTCVMAALLNRNGVGVELEEHFYGMGLANKALTDKLRTLTPKGKITVLRGDARCLSEILGEVDQIITSPPFSDSFRANPNVDFEKRVKKMIEVEKNAVAKGQKWSVSSEEAIKRRVMMQDFGYSTTMDSIITSPPYESMETNTDDPKRVQRIQEALKKGEKISKRNMNWLKARLEGRIQKTTFDRIGKYSGGVDSVAKVDAVITSPPYEKTIGRQGGDCKLQNVGISTKTARAYSAKVDSIITSPPYSEGIGHGRGKDTKILDEKKLFLHGKDSYSKVDVVLTSPPYEASLVKHNENTEKEVAKKLGKKWMTKGRLEAHKRMQSGYTEADAENIGNLKGEKYLSQMKIVYENCFLVLKPRGKLILVVKNYIRNKAVVNLAAQTIKLCEGVGFALVERLLFKLPSKSFWRVLEAKKWAKQGREYPEEMGYEHVLIFEKEAVEGT